MRVMGLHFWKRIDSDWQDLVDNYRNGRSKILQMWLTNRLVDFDLLHNAASRKLFRSSLFLSLSLSILISFSHLFFMTTSVKSVKSFQIYLRNLFQSEKFHVRFFLSSHLTRWFHGLLFWIFFLFIIDLFYGWCCM